MSPRNLHEFLVGKLLESKNFHKFVRSIHARINGHKPTDYGDQSEYHVRVVRVTNEAARVTNDVARVTSEG